jgi:hypothetical protein
VVKSIFEPAFEGLQRTIVYSPIARIKTSNSFEVAFNLDTISVKILAMGLGSPLTETT